MFETLWALIVDKVFTEAGLIACLLFCAVIYLGIENKKKEKKIDALHERIHAMGVNQIQATSETNNVLDKLTDTLQLLMMKGK